MTDEEMLPPHEQTTIHDTGPGQLRGTWPPPPRPAPRQVGFPIGLTIALTTLALILIAGGFGFIIFSVTAQYNGVFHTQATVQARSTARANATVQAQAQQTELAVTQTLTSQQAGLDASATAIAASTVTARVKSDNATATVTALQDLLAQDMNGTPAVDDSLSDSASPGRWDLNINAQNNTGCQFINGNYHVKEVQYGYYQPCFAEATDFHNFVYQVTMTIDQGSQGGILFRANSAQSQYYLFRIGTDGSYTLEVYDNNHVTPLSSGFSAAILTGIGQSNTLQVIAQNSTIDLFVNSTFINSVSDSSYASGQIGVVALDYSLPTEIEFSNAQVWTL